MFWLYKCSGSTNVLAVQFFISCPREESERAARTCGDAELAQMLQEEGEPLDSLHQCDGDEVRGGGSSQGGGGSVGMDLGADERLARRLQKEEEMEQRREQREAEHRQRERADEEWDRREREEAENFYLGGRSQVWVRSGQVRSFICGGQGNCVRG